MKYSNFFRFYFWSAIRREAIKEANKKYSKRLKILTEEKGESSSELEKVFSNISIILSEKRSQLTNLMHETNRN